MADTRGTEAASGDVARRTTEKHPTPAASKAARSRGARTAATVTPEKVGIMRWRLRSNWPNIMTPGHQRSINWTHDRKSARARRSCDCRPDSIIFSRREAVPVPPNGRPRGTRISSDPRLNPGQGARDLEHRAREPAGGD